MARERIPKSELLEMIRESIAVKKVLLSYTGDEKYVPDLAKMSEIYDSFIYDEIDYMPRKATNHAAHASASGTG